MQLAISRQREYLADASGVELTRNPVGLEQALAKIALDTEPLEVANRATQHLYFENPIKGVSGKQSDLFSTHPPVLDRINRLRALTSQPPIDDPEIVLGLASASGGRPDPRRRPRPAGAVQATGVGAALGGIRSPGCSPAGPRRRVRPLARHTSPPGAVGLRNRGPGRRACNADRFPLQ